MDRGAGAAGALGPATGRPSCPQKSTPGMGEATAGAGTDCPLRRADRDLGRSRLCLRWPFCLEFHRVLHVEPIRHRATHSAWIRAPRRGGLRSPQPHHLAVDGGRARRAVGVGSRGERASRVVGNRRRQRPPDRRRSLGWRDHRAGDPAPTGRVALQRRAAAADSLLDGGADGVRGHRGRRRPRGDTPARLSGSALRHGVRPHAPGQDGAGRVHAPALIRRLAPAPPATARRGGDRGVRHRRGCPARIVSAAADRGRGPAGPAAVHPREPGDPAPR